MRSRGPRTIAVLSIMVMAFLIGIVSIALAGNNPEAKVAIHVRDHNAKAACNPGVIIAGCADIVTTYAGFSTDAYPVFYDLAEFKGVEYGVCWPAWTYSAAFANCADLVIGAIAWSGEGASHTWLACQMGVAIPSFLWLYADGPGMICPCPHPVTGLISILDCAEGLDSPIGVFCAGVYGMDGDDPCECPASATETSTWGGIKGVFK